MVKVRVRINLQYPLRYGRCCVRSQYPEDATIGFFLAKFVRKGHTPPAPAAELQAKLEILERSRAKRAAKLANIAGRGKAAMPVSQATKEQVEAEAEAVKPVDKVVPEWREQRDQRRKLAKKRKREGIANEE